VKSKSEYITGVINSTIGALKQITESPVILNMIGEISRKMVGVFDSGGKVMFCGNGGSASDAQHLAAELSGKFYLDRKGLPAEALHTNTSYITAVANDYSYDQIYERMVRGSGKKGDLLFALSTSGNSMNLVKAVEAAKELGIFTVALTGEGGGELAPKCDMAIRVPSKETPRIQEAHIVIGHIICEIVEHSIFSNDNR